MSEPLMPLDHMAEELDCIVVEFRNAMLREGVKALPPDEWFERFRVYLAGIDFARQYRETLVWVAEMDRRDG